MLSEGTVISQLILASFAVFMFTGHLNRETASAHRMYDLRLNFSFDS